jgi:hypothetical protein
MPRTICLGSQESGRNKTAWLVAHGETGRANSRVCAVSTVAGSLESCCVAAHCLVWVQTVRESIARRNSYGPERIERFGGETEMHGFKPRPQWPKPSAGEFLYGSKAIERLRDETRISSPEICLERGCTWS